MENDPLKPQKQSAVAFWKSYFAKFRRRVEDHEQSETTPAALGPEVEKPLPFPDRRRSRLQRNPRR